MSRHMLRIQSRTTHPTTPSTRSNVPSLPLDPSTLSWTLITLPRLVHAQRAWLALPSQLQCNRPSLLSLYLPAQTIPKSHPRLPILQQRPPLLRHPRLVCVPAFLATNLPKSPRQWLPLSTRVQKRLRPTPPAFRLQFTLKTRTATRICLITLITAHSSQPCRRQPTLHPP